eukprot:gene20622-27421_t
MYPNMWVVEGAPLSSSKASAGSTILRNLMAIQVGFGVIVGQRIRLAKKTSTRGRFGRRWSL